jgi:2-aminomuconate deaminase
VTDSQAVTVAGKAIPRGRFPHVKVAHGMAWVSGTSSRRPDDTIAGAEQGPDGGMKLDIAVQTREVLANITDILASVGAGLADLVQVTAYLTSMTDFDAYNAVYAEHFDESGPTRTTVGVAELPHPHLLIEIQAVAVLPGRA